MIATSKSPPTQAILPFEKPEIDGRIPDERKAECIALIRELMETVASLAQTQPGGTHD